MKLGTQTNSIVNHLMSRAVIGQPNPVVGMGVTFLSWTDRNPGTIFRVFTHGKSLLIETRDDDYRRTDRNGMSEDQSYDFVTKVNGAKRYFKLCGDTWKCVRRSETGRWVLSGERGLRIGERDKYHDFSF